MVLLMIFQDLHPGMTGNEHPKSVTLFEETMDEAIRIGQRSGQYYEIFDFATGRNTDWNEINFSEEDEWYYDEEEMIWKKRPAETFAMEGNINDPFPVHVMNSGQGYSRQGMDVML